MTLPVQTEMIALTVISAVICAILSPFLLMGRQSYISTISCRAAILGIALGGLIADGLSSFSVVSVTVLVAFIGTVAVNSLSKIVSISRLSVFITSGALFLSIGAILTSIPGGVSMNSLIFGETSLSSFSRISLFYIDLGPKGLYALLLAFLLIGLCLFLFYKDMKLELFDESYAASLYSKRNFRPMLLPALTAVAVGVSAQVAGIFMTPALLLLPAATAYFYTKRLSAMIVISVIVALASSLTGYGIAYDFNSSPIGGVVCVMGILFILSSIFAPEAGLLYRTAVKRSEEETLREHVILRDLMNEKAIEDIFDYHDETVMSERLNMRKDRFKSIISKLIATDLVQIENETISLTAAGKEKCLLLKI